MAIVGYLGVVCGAGWKVTQEAEVRGRFDVTLFCNKKTTQEAVPV